MASPAEVAAPAPVSNAVPAPSPAPAPNFTPDPAPNFAPAPMSAAAPAAAPRGLSQPIRPVSRRPLVFVALGLAVAIAIAATVVLTNETAEPEAELDTLHIDARSMSACERLEALAGSWVFSTATTGARRKERLGMRGFYELDIAVDGCTATASMAKTGRTDRKVFDDHKIPRAEATLVQGQGAEAYGWTGPFELRNEDGQGIDTQFVLAIDGERMVGSWRQLGERWESSGLYGVLEGRREGDPIEIRPTRSEQPCTVRCATPEDIALIDTPDPEAHAACLASCQ